MGIAIGRIASKLRMVFEMSDTRVVFKNLATPERAIITIAETITHDGREIIEIVFGGDTESMGTVVLNRDKRNTELLRELFSVERCHIGRMSIAEYGLRHDVYVAEEALKSILIVCESIGVRCIAKVRRKYDSPATIVESKGAIHLGTKSEEWWRVCPGVNCD